MTIYLLLIVAMMFAMWAQVNVQSTFTKYSKVKNSAGITGFDAARMILDANGLYNVKVERVSGNLTDHYDPRTNVIRLSDAVFSANTASAIGVAAHEAGHAVQYARNYAPTKFRSAIVPACQVGSYLSWPLILLGIIFTIPQLAYAGVILFSLTTIFSAITLPCEFDASSRAIKALSASGMLREDDIDAARKTLKAAALTYVAALAVSLLQLLRVVSMVRRND
ncbi:MAG: zinc metallopeptidase [Ruminococcaceae bacterium]|nr:zinc metallopeptidase [Oscillospiraceae bacterium]